MSERLNCAPLASPRPPLLRERVARLYLSSPVAAHASHALERRELSALLVLACRGAHGSGLRRAAFGRPPVAIKAALPPKACVSHYLIAGHHAPLHSLSLRSHHSFAVILLAWAHHPLVPAPAVRPPTQAGRRTRLRVSGLQLVLHRVVGTAAHKLAHFTL